MININENRKLIYEIKKYPISTVDATNLRKFENDLNLYIIEKSLTGISVYIKTDYERLYGSQIWQNEINLYFDENQEQTWIQGNAKYILTWKQGKCGIGYY